MRFPEHGSIGAFCGVFRRGKRVIGARYGVILPLEEHGYFDRIRSLLSDDIVEGDWSTIEVTNQYERIFFNSVQMIILLEKNRESIRLKDIGYTWSLSLECYEKSY